MASPAPAAPQTQSGNLFQFATPSGKTKVTYYPFAPGPLIQGRTPGPSFEYDGPEGSLNFRAEQITQENTAVGQLLSVVLKAQDDSGSVIFSVFLPPVEMAGDDSQVFNTYGIRTHHVGSSQKRGAQMTYEIERFNGQAKVVALAL